MSESVDQKFRDAPQRLYMTMDESIALSQRVGELILESGTKPDLIVGLVNGGILPAAVVSDVTGVPVEMVRVRRSSSRIKQRLSFLKSLLRLPPWFLALKPINAVSKFVDLRFGKVEGEAKAFDFDIAGKTVAIVDDAMDSGSSAAYVKTALLERGAKGVSVAVICWSDWRDSQALHGIVPDIWLHRRLHYFPWAMNNADYKAFVSWIEARGYPLWK